MISLYPPQNESYLKIIFHSVLLCIQWQCNIMASQLQQKSLFAYSSDYWDYSVVLCTLFICCCLIPFSMGISQVHWTMTVCTDVVMHASKVGGTCFVCFCWRESPHFSLCLSQDSKSKESHSSNTLTFLKGTSYLTVCVTDILHRSNGLHCQLVCLSKMKLWMCCFGL